MRNGASKNRDSFLRCFFPVVDCIADFLGPGCEVLLHDILNLEHSIIKIRNGHVTGRKVGDSLTDLGLEMIKRGDRVPEVLGNYNPRAKNGRMLKSNSAHLRDMKGRLVGALCINLDLTQVKKMEENLQQITKSIKDFSFVDNEKTIKDKEEHFESDLWSMVQDMINGVIEKKAKPVIEFSKEEKMEIVRLLNEKGIFSAKGAIYHVSSSLGLSSSTIYRYLEELKSNQRGKKIL
jgi:predicted transcriptional regulator YheO